MGDWVRSKGELLDFVSLVLLYAPDEFPREDFLQPHEQLDLHAAFDELRQGLETFLRADCDPGVFMRLQSLIEDSYSHYEQGRILDGGRALQAFRALAFE